VFVNQVRQKIGLKTPEFNLFATWVQYCFIGAVVLTDKRFKACGIEVLN